MAAELKKKLDTLPKDKEEPGTSDDDDGACIIAGAGGGSSAKNKKKKDAKKKKAAGGAKKTKGVCHDENFALPATHCFTEFYLGAGTSAVEDEFDELEAAFQEAQLAAAAPAGAGVSADIPEASGVVIAPREPGCTPNRVPLFRGVKGFTDSFVAVGQTDPPSITVRPPPIARFPDKLLPRLQCMLSTNISTRGCCCAGGETLPQRQVPGG
jgi:hypothetical protein